MTVPGCAVAWLSQGRAQIPGAALILLLRLLQAGKNPQIQHRTSCLFPLSSVAVLLSVAV